METISGIFRECLLYCVTTVVIGTFLRGKIGAVKDHSKLNPVRFMCHQPECLQRQRKWTPSSHFGRAISAAKAIFRII